MVVRIEPVDTKRVKAVAGKFRQFPSELKNNFRKAQRAAINPIWREEMASSAQGASRTQQAVFKSGNRTKAGLPAQVVAGSGRRAMRGGGTPVELNRAYEFGTNDPNATSTYSRRSKNGGRHKVTRRTRRQLPTFRRAGYVVYPAFAKAMPRLAKLHVQTLARQVYDAINKS